MINLNITVDLDSFTKGMTELQETQVPFATAKALNAVGLDVQVAERVRLREVFTIRRQAFADRSIKITHFAKKAEPYTTVAIASPDSDGGRPNVFAKFETDTQKTPFGSHGIAVPLKDGQIRRGVIPDSQKPAAFHLHREGNQIVGDNGTYVVKLADGRELLLQRKDLGKRAAKKAGRGTREESTPIFLFVPVVKINANLEYVPHAEVVVDRMWAVRFDEVFSAAMASAK